MQSLFRIGNEGELTEAYTFKGMALDINPTPFCRYGDSASILARGLFISQTITIDFMHYKW